MAVCVRDVAERAGVSVGTVSNVLNRPEKVCPETVERVHAAIGELGFVRNDAARQLRAGRSRTVGLVVLDVRNPFFTERRPRCRRPRRRARGCRFCSATATRSVAREAAYLDLFEEQRVHGVLISPIGDIDGAARAPARARHPRGARRPQWRRQRVLLRVDGRHRRRLPRRQAPDRPRPHAHRLPGRAVRDPPGHRPPRGRSPRRCRVAGSHSGGHHLGRPHGRRRPPQR